MEEMKTTEVATNVAEELLNTALNTAEGSRKAQKELFSTHFGGTTDLLKVKKAAERTLSTLDTKVAQWKANLETLLEAIKQKEANAGFDSTTIRGSILKPACINFNFAKKNELWTK